MSAALTPIQFTVKNTFLDVGPAHGEETVVRRSSSVPRTFKPGDSTCCHSVYSGDSTSASDKDTIDNLPDTSSSRTHDEFADNSSDGEQDFPDYNEFATSGICAPCEAPPDKLSLVDLVTKQHGIDRSKVKLSLEDMVTQSEQKTRLKLRPSARPFQSVRAPPDEVMAIINSAVEVMSSGKEILDVRVRNEGMGGTTMIVAKSSSGNPDTSWTFSFVKDALLNAAEQSERTYILGYGYQPFKSLDHCSFSTTICCLPTAHQDTACWDTYEHGCCPRRATCHWDHPSENDMMRLIVMVTKNA